MLNDYRRETITKSTGIWFRNTLYTFVTGADRIKFLIHFQILLNRKTILLKRWYTDLAQ